MSQIYVPSIRDKSCRIEGIIIIICWILNGLGIIVDILTVIYLLNNDGNRKFIQSTKNTQIILSSSKYKLKCYKIFNIIFY